MQEEQTRLQLHASSLADRLDAVLEEKRHRRQITFDSETPVDKTLNYLQSIISVSMLTNAQPCLCACSTFIAAPASYTVPA